MADIVFLWIYLLSISQHRAVFRERRTHRRSRGYVLNHHRSLRKSHVALSTSLWSSLLILPPFQQLIRSLRSPRRFWAAPREQGFWEKDVCLLWRSMGRIYPDWKDKQYLQHFRVSKDTFWYLCQTYGKHFKKQTTHLRRPLLPSKRLAIVLHWLAQSNSYSELAAMYAVGKSTVVAIAHEGIALLREKLVPEAILSYWTRARSSDGGL